MRRSSVDFPQAARTDQGDQFSRLRRKGHGIQRKAVVARSLAGKILLTFSTLKRGAFVEHLRTDQLPFDDSFLPDEHAVAHLEQERS